MIAQARLTDERSLDVLDFGAIRTLVARQTMSDRAAARARELTPTTDLLVVRAEQAATREMRSIAAEASFALPRVTETGPALARAERGSPLGAEELREVGIALAAADAAVRRVRSARAPELVRRTAAARPLLEIAAAIDRAVGERGEVLDRASPALARLRRNATLAQDEARERCQAILRAPRFAKAIQESIVTTREGRFVIPVKAEFAGAVPGVVHDTSSSGHTLFVEPLDALDVNNRLRTLRIEEEREVARILAELSALVGRHAGQAETNLEILAGIDLVLARARVAEAMDAVSPRVVDASRIDIREGRHPLLGRRAVPQSLVLDDATRFIVISGPNMGGKTVALKMLGLFVAMTYCGLQIPAAEGATIGAFEDLGCDIGDEQSIVENASTFSAHLRRMRAIVERAGPRSLVLVDEIAGGTEPAAGAALAIALLENLLASGAHGVVTTHATELKLFAHATPGIRNASVRFDPQTYAPTYELDLGAPGQSLAFPLARSLGLSVPLVERAEELLERSERDYDKALAELSEIRTEAAAERDELRRERSRLTGLEASARERAEALDRERRNLARQAEARLSRALREFSAELERRHEGRPGRARVTPGQANLLERVLDEVHSELGLPPRVETPAPPPPGTAKRTVAIGDEVFVPSLGTDGSVVDDYGDSLLIAVGAMKTVVPKAQVRPREAAPEPAPRGTAPGRGTSRGGQATLDAAAGARSEFDVRGRRFVEAEPLVERWIDSAALAGISPLRLIHGKGTGLLGRGLQEALAKNEAVRSYRYGNADEGGGGVTVIELK